jgi:hypothetical protein
LKPEVEKKIGQGLARAICHAIGEKIEKCKIDIVDAGVCPVCALKKIHPTPSRRSQPHQSQFIE